MHLKNLTFAILLLSSLISKADIVNGDYIRSDADKIKYRNAVSFLIKSYHINNLGKETIGFSQCSGTLLTQRLILTAAHCVIDRGANSKIGFYNEEKLNKGMDGKDAIEILNVAKYNTYPGYFLNKKFEDKSSGNFGGDFSFIELAEDISKTLPVYKDIKAWKLNSENIVEAQTPGDLITIGSGYKGKNDKNPKNESKKKCHIDVKLGFDKEEESYVLENNPCDIGAGDSGGPIIQCQSEDCTIIGVTSNSTTEDDDAEDNLSHFSKVTNDLICWLEFNVKNSNLGCLDSFDKLSSESVQKSIKERIILNNLKNYLEKLATNKSKVIFKLNGKDISFDVENNNGLVLSRSMKKCKSYCGEFLFYQSQVTGMNIEIPEGIKFSPGETLLKLSYRFEFLNIQKKSLIILSFKSSENLNDIKLDDLYHYNDGNGALLKFPANVK